MKFLFIYISAFILIFSGLLQGQIKRITESSTLAEAGNYKITVREFKERYQFSPHPRQSGSPDADLKKEYLYTLIAEKLLAQKARLLMLDTTGDVRGYSDYMERLFVKDALYRKEILGNKEITGGEIEEARNRISKVLLVKYLNSKDEEEINVLYSQLKRGASFDSLLAGRSEAEEQKTLGKVTYGSLDKFVEDSLYNLKIGQFTLPLYTGKRWYVFKLYDIINQPYFDTPDVQSKIKRTLEEREIDDLQKNYLYRLLHRLKIDVDRHLFTQILNEIVKYLKAREAAYKDSERPKFIYLIADDFNKIKDSLGTTTLNSVFIKYEKNPETVEQFLTQLSYNGFKAANSDTRLVTQLFDNYVKNYIQSELLARQGYDEHLQNTAPVKKDLELWQNYYLALKLERMILDSVSVSDAEAYDFYSKNHDLIFPAEQVNVQEILVENLESVQSVFEELDKKIPFTEAAKKFSIIDSLKTNGGELGFLPAAKLGSIGRAAIKMKVGDVYGPIKVPEGFAIIKLIGRKEGGEQKDTSFVNIKNDLKEIIQGIKLKSKLKDYVSDLALQFGVEINKDALNSVRAEQINTVTIRMIGFGGRIYAFPYEPLFGGWYELYLKKKSEVPQ